MKQRMGWIWLLGCFFLGSGPALAEKQEKESPSFRALRTLFALKRSETLGFESLFQGVGFSTHFQKENLRFRLKVEWSPEMEKLLHLFPDTTSQPSFLDLFPERTMCLAGFQIHANQLFRVFPLLLSSFLVRETGDQKKQFQILAMIQFQRFLGTLKKEGIDLAQLFAEITGQFAYGLLFSKRIQEYMKKLQKSVLTDDFKGQWTKSYGSLYFLSFQDSFKAKAWLEVLANKWELIRSKLSFLKDVSLQKSTIHGKEVLQFTLKEFPFSFYLLQQKKGWFGVFGKEFLPSLLETWSQKRKSMQQTSHASFSLAKNLNTSMFFYMDRRYYRELKETMSSENYKRYAKQFFPIQSQLWKQISWKIRELFRTGRSLLMSLHKKKNATQLDFLFEMGKKSSPSSPSSRPK